MHSQIKRLCNQTLTIYPVIGTVDGTPNFGTPITRSCYSVAVERRFRTSNGEEVISQSTIYLDGAFVNDIHPKDEVEVTFPPYVDRPLITRRPILNLQPIPLLFGGGIDQIEVLV